MPKKIDLTNCKIGKWTVVCKANNIGKRTAWECVCECGTRKIVATEVLTKKQSTSCGCSRYDHLKNKPKYEDLTGQKFGRLTVIKLSDKKNERIYWECLCECGDRKNIPAKQLKSGKTNSCGCIQKETISNISKRHGKSKTRIYTIWVGMKMRCNNANCKAYKHYGDRGIKLCDEWNDFEQFEEWAKCNGYNDDLSIERIDYNDGYNPKNCTWIPINKQSSNRRSVVNIEYNGEIKLLTEWARYFNISHSTVQYHLKKGTIKECFDKYSKQYK